MVHASPGRGPDRFHLPGKKADLVIIDTKAVNVAPVIDPVGAVVCAADISNVRTVLVDGRW